ncbi:TAM-1 protein [Aphelenchoides avenae]|nr:TAM-1 protein [Aphelenchus avenae]
MTDAVTTACLESLECPVCWNLYNDPKQLSCGHTLCAGCVTQLVGAAQTRNVGLGGDSAAALQVILCPECRNPTSVPLGGLKTNYRLMDLVSKMSGVGLNELHKCSTCEKRWAAGELFTCKTCEDSFQTQVWICGVCAIKQHKDHNVVETDLATKEDRDAAVATIKQYATQGKEAGRELMGLFERSFNMCHTVLQEFAGSFEQYCAMQKELAATKSIRKDDLKAALEKAEMLHECYAKATEAAKKANDSVAEVLTSGLAAVRDCFDEQDASDAAEQASSEDTVTSSTQPSMSGTHASNPFMFTPQASNHKRFTFKMLRQSRRHYARVSQDAPGPSSTPPTDANDAAVTGDESDASGRVVVKARRRRCD